MPTKTTKTFALYCLFRNPDYDLKHWIEDFETQLTNAYLEGYQLSIMGDFNVRACCYFCCVAYAAETGFNSLSIGFPYFTNVQLLCSLSRWLHLNCFSIGTGFNGAETNCRTAHNLGILLMNSNCFAIFFQRHYSYVYSDIYLMLICL